ncbi:MAG TPA: formylglycine-generating enzyme family protein [archaeon]|nr:formylglycine-generating enzyme family protein [archaeon]
MIKDVLWLLVSAAFVVMPGCGKEPVTPPENYTIKVPGTELEIEMVYVPGGEFEMGSPENEPGHETDEGPVRKVRVEPFWIGKTEVTWEQYEKYAFAKDPTMIDAITLPSPKINPTWIKQGIKWLRQRVDIALNDSLDAITRPSPYYGDFYHGMGRSKKPAIGVSWLGVSMFCEWLSKKTGQHYRLPTEAEWEFAARAGSQTAYSFGDDPAELSEYAWYEQNSDWETQNVGLKHPNELGIHDMLGNVWEFCLDGYDPDFYKKLKNPGVNVEPQGPEIPLGPIKDIKPTLRGGSWDDPASELRSANRLEQLDWWNERDPQRPRGAWWLVDGNVVGFRVCRSAE